MNAVTWDGLPIAAEPPTGATVIVFRRPSASTVELLCLHRRRLPDDGDWAWGPPSGCRFPGEDDTVTAARELAEETGIVAQPAPVVPSSGAVEAWSTFALEVAAEAAVTLSDEHDRLSWLTPAAAVALVSPEVVRRQIRAALSASGISV